MNAPRDSTSTSCPKCLVENHDIALRLAEGIAGIPGILPRISTIAAVSSMGAKL
jgi:hypothetical protein